MRFSTTPFLTAALGAVLFGATSVSAAAMPADTPPNIAMFSSLQNTNYDQRKEIYGSLPKAEQNNYWVKKIETFRSNNDGLSDDQHLILDGAVEVIKTQDQAAAGGIEKAMKDAFGFEKVKKLMTTLYLEDEDENEGDQLERRKKDCTCSKASDYCDWREECVKGGCGKIESDCGFGYMFDCDGICHG